MKVLIGIDGSAGSLDAVQFVGPLLVPGRDQIALCQARPKPAARGKKAKELQQSIIDAVFDEARARLPEALRPSVETLVNVRKPQQALIAVAGAWGAELIVVGARGLSPIRSLFLGSVSRSVADAAKVPVLVVRPIESGAGSGLKLLLADDGSTIRRDAARILQQFAWPAGTVGRLISVIDSLYLGEIPPWIEGRIHDAILEAMAKKWRRDHEIAKQERLAALTAAGQELPEPFRNAEPLVFEGNPGDQILRAATAERSDLVIIGRTGSGRVSRLLAGSTSLPVLAHAPCSVLVVPRRA